MKQTIQTIIFAFFLTFFAASQSKVEWFQFAESAFQEEDYLSAASMYMKMLEAPSRASRSVPYPYAMRYYSKTQQADTALTQPSSNIDSASQSAQQRSPGNLLLEISEAEIHHKIAESYRLGFDYENAETWYRRSVSNNSPDYPVERYWYAVSLMRNEKYPLAIQQIDSFKTDIKKDDPMFKKADKIVANCKYALNKNNQKKDILEELDSAVNKGFSTLAPVYYEASSIAFSSAKIPAEKKKLLGKQENTSLEVFIAKRSGKYWSESTAMPEPVNSDQHEVGGVFSEDKTSFFFTRSNPENKKECAIYLSKFLNGMWLLPLKLNENVNKEGFRSMQPTISKDGSKLYFASDMPGGQGKMDIWSCNIDDKGNAGPALNMGKRINTPEDEVTPFFHAHSNTLFYSSEGLVGMGGLDVFKSTLNTDDSTWAIPKNLGAPINSGREESYFVLDKEQKTGYVSSDRKGCKDCTVGNCYKIYSIIKEPYKFTVHGVVYNSETNQPLPNALLTFKDVHGDTPNFFVITDSAGAYTRELPSDIELFVKAQKNRFFADANSVSTIGLTESASAERDFFLAPIPLGDIVIPGIEYDYDKATLRPVSIKILDDLYEFLLLNDNISVQISSHTDERGTDEYNMVLSVARAKSVVDYLMSKGMPQDRLLPHGYGKTEPIIPHEKIAKMATEEEKEEAHQRNRRTAFKPIKEEELRTN